MSEDNLVKLAIPSERGGLRHETVWAAPLGDDLYEIRNIPWLVDGIHHRDVVRCTRPRESGFPELVEVVRPSGHDTLHLVFTESASPELRNKTLQELERNLGYSERAGEDGWAIDVNPGTDLSWALEYLGQLQAAGYLEGEPAES